jgi:hypothetical protein
MKNYILLLFTVINITTAISQDYWPYAVGDYWILDKYRLSDMKHIQVDSHIIENKLVIGDTTCYTWKQYLDIPNDDDNDTLTHILAHINGIENDVYAKFFDFGKFDFHKWVQHSYEEGDSCFFEPGPWNLKASYYGKFETQSGETFNDCFRWADDGKGIVYIMAPDIGIIAGEDHFHDDYREIVRHGKIITSTVDDKFNLNIEIFPNPTSDFIHFKTSSELHSYNVRLYNFKSEVLFSKTMDLGDGLDVSDLPPGVYVLQLENDNSTKIQKLFVKL